GKASMCRAHSHPAILQYLAKTSKPYCLVPSTVMAGLSPSPPAFKAVSAADLDFCGGQGSPIMEVDDSYSCVIGSHLSTIPYLLTSGTTYWLGSTVPNSTVLITSP
ncbi:hypothetical protein HaLaN_07845, partial [Haematococcus lacustris]